MATNRITQTLELLKGRGHKALIGYLTAGDPDMATSERHMRTALENGVDILELGVPFSDPTADGPIIQAAGQRALRAGATLHQILELAGRLRQSFTAPMVLFSYANPLLAYGYDKVCAAAAAAGLDGLLVVDMPLEEAAELRPHLQRHGLLHIQLVAPTTPPARAQAILAQAAGFVYYISVKGVTGTRADLAADLGAHIAELRQYTAQPIAVGFGISNGSQARAAAAHADAVVVGSALVRAAQEDRLADLVRELAAALRGPTAAD
ncbi:MAG: tryptophan synthase subunit alpha [Lentisphaerae bacterium]|jgi:tryptophan synthase alpha chain|nr:tryptophan synthase subunit alpha [Lentisphaerota bacterium]